MLLPLTGGIQEPVIYLLIFSIQYSTLHYFYKSFYSSSWTCAKLHVSILYLFFSFSNKKASKARKDMQGIHEGTEAKLLPTACSCCPPLFLYYRTIYALAQVQQHVPSALSCTPSSLCFLLFFWVIASHTHTKKPTVVFKVLSKSKRSHLQLLRWLLFVTVYVSLCFYLPCMHRQCILSFLLFYPLLLFIVFTQDCTPTWITAQLKQTSSSYVPPHYSFDEGFTALLWCIKTLPEDRFLIIRCM